jgi:hypothetical protein
MTEEQIALAKRAVACRGWRWMPGMLGFDPDGINDPVRVAFPPGKAYRMPTLEAWGRPSYIVHCELPDLTDPATLGCLLALVRESHAVPYLQVSVKISREHGYQFDCHPHHRGQWVDSEAEALVAALEAAPCGQ